MHLVPQKRHTMKKHLMLILPLLSLSFSMHAIDANIQLFYDFGSKYTHLANQRSDRITTTVEFFHPDQWGSTFFFVDIDYSIRKTDANQSDPKNTPFGSYWEFTRCLNFWQHSKAKDLSIHVEYNGGLGIYGSKVVQGGYGINHAVLVGPDYFLHTPDYKNTFNLQLMYKLIADDWNLYKRYEWTDDHGVTHETDGSGNLIPLQFTFIWKCLDFCTVPGLTFSGFLDIWGQKLNVLDQSTNTFTNPEKQSFVFISEPQLWYAFGQHFKCPNLCVGAEVEFSYNFTGKGFMCNPCIGLRWLFL